MSASLRSLVPFVSVLLIACAPRLPSSRVEFDGRKVEVVEAGAGDVTVVFESGLGNDWTDWDPIAVEVATHARVFAYSRPGYGKSEATSTPRTGAQIVEELHALLHERGFEPPYLLVGHSFGGAYQELFARTYPGEVAGLVVVDGRHRDFSAACEAAGIAECGITPAMAATMPRVQRDELEAYSDISAEIAHAGPFGAYPVRVLTAGSHGHSRAFETLWASQQLELAHEAEDGEQLVFPDATHALPFEQPQKVAELITSLLPVPLAR